MPCMADLPPSLTVSTSESGNVVYALRVTTYNQESWEEEKQLAEQYGMPYKEKYSIK